MRKVIGAVIINERKILLVKKKKTWITPGGKPDPGESDDVCLRREMEEELSGTRITNLRFYKDFTGKSPHKGDTVKVSYYFADIEGKLQSPSAEISDRVYWDGISPINLSEPTEKLMDALRIDNYL